MIFEISLEGSSLVRGGGEDVGEAAAGVDYGLGCFFRLGYAGAGLDLSGAYGGDIRAGAGE